MRKRFDPLDIIVYAVVFAAFFAHYKKIAFLILMLHFFWRRDYAPND